jgi:hypothetical protein
MADVKKNLAKVITPPFIISHPNIVEATQFNGKGEFRWDSEMIFEPDVMNQFKIRNGETGQYDSHDINKICAVLAKREWDLEAGFGVGGVGWPIKDGSAEAVRRQAARVAKGKDKADFSHLEGRFVTTAKTYVNSQIPLKVVFPDGEGGREVLERGNEKSEGRANSFFYPGAIGFAALTVKPTISGDGKYITFYLNDIRFLKHGDRIGGVNDMDNFMGVTGGYSEYDATEGMDDDIPF